MKDNDGFTFPIGHISPITGAVTVEMWDDDEQIGEFCIINGHADFSLSANWVLDLETIAVVHEKMISLPKEHPVTFDFSSKRPRHH